MKTMILQAILAAVAVVTAEAMPAATTPPDSCLGLVIEVGSRLYPDWRETVRVRLGETFFLGDSEFTARVSRFVPDFRIDKGEILSVSQQLANPAARVIVDHDTTAADSSWAFLNFPPHFSPRSFFTFKLKEIHGFVPGPAVETTSRPNRESATTQAAPAAADTLERKPEKGRHE